MQSPPVLALHHDLAFAHLALPVEDREQGLVGRAAYHVGRIGEAFDDPRQILGRLLMRALWGRWGPLTFPGRIDRDHPRCLGARKWVASSAPFLERASACSRGPATNRASATAGPGRRYWFYGL
jgi:hypothetical protein